MPSAFGGLVALCIGVYALTSREWIARSALEWDRLAFGLRFNPKWYELGSFLGALVFIVMGLLALSGIIELAPQV
jgi:hypothetical protein